MGRYDGIGTNAALMGLESSRATVSLWSRNGPWVAGLLMGVVVLTGLPVGVAFRHPSAQRMTTWCAAVLILGFALVAGFSVGLFYLPSAVFLLAAALLTPGDLRG
jgi:hypothetical protein